MLILIKNPKILKNVNPTEFNVKQYVLAISHRKRYFSVIESDNRRTKPGINASKLILEVIIEINVSYFL